MRQDLEDAERIKRACAVNYEIDQQLGYLREHRPGDDNPVALALESIAYSLALIARALDEANDR